MQNYIIQFNTAIVREDGESLANFLNVNDKHVQTILSVPENSIRMIPPWDDVVNCHVRTVKALHAENDVIGAAEAQNLVVLNLLKAIQTLNRNFLDPLYQACLDLETIATQADDFLLSENKKATWLEEAARTINTAFGRCANDRAALPNSRKWGTYRVINILFRIYFRLGNQNLCVSVARALNKQEMPPFDQFPMADQVTFSYYTGVLAFFDENYQHAEEKLSFAFQHCLKSSFTNQLLILHYLIPVRLMKGRFPSHNLLSRYPSLEALYTPIVDAIIKGDVGAFDASLQEREDDLIQRGTFLTVERARFLCIRNLFKKVYLLKEKSARITIPEFAAALKWVTKSNDDDAEWNAEVECMVANLIDKGYIKGYISHERQTAVLAKEGAFPRLEDVK